MTRNLHFLKNSWREEMISNFTEETKKNDHVILT